MISLFALQLVGWMLTPLVAFGVDETVDPARFALLPIRPQTLQRGLLVTSLIGFFPLANFVVLIGAAVALGVPWSVLPIALVCVVPAAAVVCRAVPGGVDVDVRVDEQSTWPRPRDGASGSVIFLAYMALRHAASTARTRTAGRCSPG